MKERPILFKGYMVNEILGGRKTQTRRPLKLPKDCMLEEISIPWMRPTIWLEKKEKSVLMDCPHGMPGDQLWVRETFSGPYGCRKLPPRDWPVTCPLWHWADGNPKHGDWTKPYPSIHMPRWASRLDLGITSAHVERLHDISEEDAEAEGVDFMRHYPDSDESLTARELFRLLWIAVNGEKSWDANPWAWVVKFEQVKP